MLKTAIDPLGLSGNQTPASIGCAGSGLCSAVSQDATSGRLAADNHSFLTLRNKLETIARRAENLLVRRVWDHQLIKHMTGKHIVDVFVVLSTWQKRRDHVGLLCCVLDTEFDAWCDVTKPFFSPEFQRTSPVENVWNFTSTATDSGSRDCRSVHCTSHLGRLGNLANCDPLQ